MKLFHTTVWAWTDIWQLKWSVFLFGTIAGAYFHDFIMRYIWVILALAVILAIKPALAYFRAPEVKG